MDHGGVEGVGERGEEEEKGGMGSGRGDRRGWGELVEKSQNTRHAIFEYSPKKLTLHARIWAVWDVYLPVLDT